MKYPLHEAVLKSDLDTVSYLFTKEVDLDELDDLGMSALHWAVMRGDLEMVMLLLEAGANPNILSGDGITPKWSAVDFSLYEIAQLLTEYGGKVNTDDNFDFVSWSVFKNILGQPLPKNEN